MLKNWFIANFKPIVQSGDLALAPVTVLAGLNSSGKSSLLQSILMTAQTLSSRLVDRPLLPNGAIVQLGTFENVISSYTHSRTLSIGFELQFPQDDMRKQAGTRAVGTGQRIRSVRVLARFGSGRGPSRSASAIEASKVEVESVTVDVEAIINVAVRDQSAKPRGIRTERRDHTISFDVKRTGETDIQGYLQKVHQDYLRLVPYVDHPNYLGRFDTEDSRPTGEGSARHFLVSFSHFLPNRLVGKFNIEEHRRERFMTMLSFALSRVRRASMSEEGLSSREGFADLPELPREDFADLLEMPLTPDITMVIDDLDVDMEVKTRIRTSSIGEFLSSMMSLRASQRELIWETVSPLIMQSPMHHATSASGEVGPLEGLELVRDSLRADLLARATDYVSDFFASKIRYLGPLRAEPQAPQRFAPSSELDEVGQRGEYAAAVYEANQGYRITHYNPFTQSVDKQVALRDALDMWARYLDIASQIRIEYAGQSGFSWQVTRREGQRGLPLSAVGVGVSQVLPILVMGLLAPAGALLIVEQPELHLHPRAQARLGEFFIGLAKCDKQCIIETHSENW